MNVPAPTVLELDMRVGAEEAAFVNMVRRLHDRADACAATESELARDLRRAASLLDACQAGLIVFPPHALTGLKVVSSAELDRLLADTNELLLCMEFEACGVPRWNAAMAKAQAMLTVFLEPAAEGDAP